MKATDFNLQDEINYNLNDGVTTFRDSRLVVFDANAIGLLRQSVVEQMGMQQAKEFFFKFAFQNGYSDFMQMKLNYAFDSEMDLLASGPVIHTWEGVVKATPSEISFDRENDEFFFTGEWSNSYEAEQHLTFNEKSEESVCWSLTGYASGWCTGFWGKPLVSREPQCIGKGDPVCTWDIRTPKAFEDGATAELALIASLGMEVK